MKFINNLFKNISPSSKLGEDAMALIHSSFYKVLRVNLKKDTYKEIYVSQDEKLRDKGYSTRFSEWLKNFAMTGNVYKDDIEKYMEFVDIENLRNFFSENLQKHSIKYRRNIKGKMRWVNLMIIPDSKYSEKNQIVFVYVYDIHDTLSKELGDTQLMKMISNSITQSYISSFYLDLENDTSRLIHATDDIKGQIDESLPVRQNMENSIKHFIAPSHQMRMREFCNIDTLETRLKDRTMISCEYLGSKNSFCSASFFPVNYGADGKLNGVIYATRYVDGEILNLRGQLKTERTLVECLTALSGTDDFTQANSKLLKNIGEFYDADSAFIFKIDREKNTVSNLFEWNEKEAESQMKKMQDVPLENFSQWQGIFRGREIILISKKSGNFSEDSVEIRLLKSYGLESVILVPFYGKNKETIGLMGLNNPKQNLDIDIVIRSAATYVLEEKLKQDYTEKLYKMSYTDIMTNTLNRAAYIRDMKRICDENEHDIGILYADVNGLKSTNDKKGHEAGDLLINNAVSLLKKYFSRKKDFIYRIGGDEFVVISSCISEKEFQTITANLKDILKSNWILSCGGAWFNMISNIDLSTNEAEKKMYKNKSEYYSSNGHADRRSR